MSAIYVMTIYRNPQTDELVSEKYGNLTGICIEKIKISETAEAWPVLYLSELGSYGRDLLKSPFKQP